MEEIIIYTQKGKLTAEELLTDEFSKLVKVQLTKVVCRSTTEASDLLGGYPFILYRQHFIQKW